MNPKRVYIDTSVVGGCFDAEFRAASLELIFRFRTGSMVAVVSDVTEFELGLAPAKVQAALARIPAAHREAVLLTEEAGRLAELYIAENVIGAASRTDAQHIATATVHRVDALVSWNFKHIVNVWRIRGYNEVNIREGYPRIAIRTPAEVLRDGE